MKTKHTLLAGAFCASLAAAAAIADASAQTTSNTNAPAPPANGLLGQYYANMDFSGKPVVQRVDAQVNFDWDEAAPVPELPEDEFSIRWRGQIEVPAGGEWTFITESDDGVRLKIDGKVILENWNRHALTEDRGRILLEAGRKYDLVLEFYDEAQHAVIRLLWEGPTRPREVIPTRFLTPGR